MRLFVFAVVGCWLSVGALADEPLLRPGDRVAFVGGTFVERMQTCGVVEAELQCRRPSWRLSVRNLGWSGDDVHGIARKRFDSPADGFQRLLGDVQTADPTVVVLAYGFSEASDGPEAVGRFAPGLRHVIGQLRDQGRRLVLMQPVAMPGYQVSGYAKMIAQCRQIVSVVGDETGVPVISIDWQPSVSELTEDQLLPSAAGYARLAGMLADRLVGGEPCGGADKERLLAQIADKNQLFFHRYRPQNETYLLLFRKHEQGNNAVEIPQFDPLIGRAEEAIWQLAAE